MEWETVTYHAYGKKNVFISLFFCIFLNYNVSLIVTDKLSV